MDDLKLLQQYFWILEKCRDPDTVFQESPNEKQYASIWLTKLCNDIYRTVDAKRVRNQYLAALSECIDKAQLTSTFLTVPKDTLPPIECDPSVKVDYGSVLNEMQVAAQACLPLTAPKSYETHMSTKIFDNNRGACAYLAVSLGDPKQGPVWMQMGSCGQPFSKDSRDSKDSTCRRSAGNSNDDESANDANVGFGQYLLQAIAQELTGQAMPCDCPDLEEQLKKYEVFIQDFPAGEEARRLRGSKLRAYLLVNLQSDLIQAMESCKERVGDS